MHKISPVPFLCSDMGNNRIHPKATIPTPYQQPNVFTIPLNVGVLQYRGPSSSNESISTENTLNSQPTNNSVNLSAMAGHELYLVCLQYYF